MENFMKFTIQLAMLSSLLDEKMISKKEFIKIKAELERNRINHIRVSEILNKTSLCG